MSTLDPTTLRRELLLEQGINRQLDKLVRQANSTAALLKNNNAMEKNQLRNLVNVAVESRSLEVVINFVRYQIARNPRAWGTGPKEFGHQVIADIRGSMRELTESAMKHVQEQGGQIPDQTKMHNDAYLHLVQLYLGYLNRAFYYGKSGKGTEFFDYLTEVANVR